MSCMAHGQACTGLVYVITSEFFSQHALLPVQVVLLAE